jgi:lipopolysaccharide transport system permease protein
MQSDHDNKTIRALRHQERRPLMLPRLRFSKKLWHHKDLLWQLSRRAIESRYRGSILGWSWSVITPLLTLGVYTFVFSEIFQSRWGNLSENNGPLTFSVNLFAGLIVFNIFSEVANQSPNTIVQNSNLATKVIFPLELLPVVSVINALFQSVASLAVLIIFAIIDASTRGLTIHPTIIFLPITWLPLASGCLAISWLLAALGVYLRDLGQVISVAVNLLMFLSAVFYPLDSLPITWRPVLELNPLVIIIEQTRKVAIYGVMPNALYVCIGTFLGIIACEASFRAFQKAKNGFADVL